MRNPPLKNVPVDPKTSQRIRFLMHKLGESAEGVVHASVLCLGACLTHEPGVPLSNKGIDVSELLARILDNKRRKDASNETGSDNHG